MLTGEKILVTGASGLVGMQLARFLAEQNEVWGLGRYSDAASREQVAAAGIKPVVADLVRLEWSISVAFVAADVAPLTRAQFTELDWDGVALRQGAGAQILAQRTNAVAIWSALSRDEAPPAAELLEEVRSVLVWRSEETPFFRTLDADEVEIFASLEQPRRFTAICEALVARIGHEPGIARAGQLLARWADDGAVAVAAGP